MKTAFLIVLFIHAVAHLPGFLKAFHFTDNLQLSTYVPRSLGMLWLFCALLFLVVFALFFLNKSWWPFFAVAAVILSQTLIMMSWQEAKYGTILNIIVLLVSVPALGHYHFEKMTEREAKSIVENIPKEPVEPITTENFAHLPQIVQKWLVNSGMEGKSDIVSVRLKQKGEMKTKPDSKWMPFTAKQYYDVKNPAFVWTTEVSLFPGIQLAGRDKFMNGEGEMQIKLLSLVNVVEEGKNERVNTGTMLRFLGEICWFPAAALNNYIQWEEVGATSAKATFVYNDEEVSGIFTFSQAGEFVSFEAERYYGGGQEAGKETWFIEAESYKEFEGVIIPAVCRVTWKLPEGDFNWLNLEITELEYNRHQLFEN